MLKRKECHGDMADIHVYTAKKLEGMADSLENLARTFDGDGQMGRNLSREDGLAALQMASAMVCGDCAKCNLYSDSQREDSYYLYYLLRAFEQNGSVGQEDMPRLFQETCRKQADYVGQLNRNLGRATMNLSWKNRFLESRDVVISQFRELAAVLDEFARQLLCATDQTPVWEKMVRRAFARRHMAVEQMLILEYDNKRKEAFLTVRTTNGRCMLSKDAAQILNQVFGTSSWMAARDSRNIIARNWATVRFVEDGSYNAVYGAARAPKTGEMVSGDNYTFCQCGPGQVVMSLSDGMGTGMQAERESRQVVELAEQLIGAGYSPRSALKLINTVLLLAGEEQHPATLDLCCIDLYSGVLEAMKLGAAATFLMGDDGVERLEAGNVPAGIVEQAEPVLLSKKLWEDSRVIMVSDGVLDALPGEDKEGTMKEYLENLERKNPQDMAEEILRLVMETGGAGRDDMTVLVAGIWRK